MSKRTYYNCAVFGCLKTTLNTNNLSFFSLPASVERRNKWLKLMNREDLLGKSSHHCRVCEDHFDDRCILKTSKRKILKKNALPKLLLPDKKYKDRGSQTTAEIADINIQCDVIKIKNDKSHTTNYLSHDSSLKRKLRNDLIMKRITELTEVESENIAFHNLCDKFLNKNFAEIVKEQTKLKYHGQGNKHSVSYKFFCLHLFYVSPEAYDLLKDTLCLPSISLLKSMYIPITTRINNHLIRILKTKVEQMTDAERNCTLVMGRMRLKPNLFYNIREDKIYGFREIDGLQSSELATYALVAIVRGIFSNYEQPVGYALVAKCSNYESVTEWIDKLIQKLQNIRLNVRTFVTDMSSDFLSSAKKRCVSAYVNNKKIFYIFDPPHLMKLVRNDLINYNFHFDSFVAKWDYILEFYEKDKTKQLRIAPKLTENHVKPSNFEKIKVKFAVEVLSTTVAAGISTYRDFGVINQSAEGTIRLITKMNDTFDFLNSSTCYGSTKYKNAFSGEEYQIAFIKDTLNFFDSLKLINRKNDKDVTTSIKFIDGFRISLMSVSLLLEDLKTEGHTDFFTHRFNHNCLENFFDRVTIKNGKLTKPTTWQLVSDLRKFFIINTLQPCKEGNSGNLSNMLLEEQKLHNNQSTSQIQPEQEDKHKMVCKGNVQRKNTAHISTRDYNTFDLPKKNALIFLCEYLLKKCAVQHKHCNLMKSYILSDRLSKNVAQDTRYTRYNDYRKNDGKQLLIIPQDEFVRFVETMEDIFTKFFQKMYIKNTILSYLFPKVEKLSFSLPCKCFPLTYCKKLYLRMRLYHTLKYNNRTFRTSPNSRKYFTVNNL